MKKITKFLLFSLIAMLLSACAVEDQYIDVPFIEVSCTTISDPGKFSQTVIYTKSDFDRMFKVTGTPVDFSTHFVVAIAHPSTQKETNIKITKVQNKERTLIIKYAVKYGKEQAQEQLPNAVIALEKGYIDCDIAIFDVSDLEY